MDRTAPRSIARRRFLRTAGGTTAGMASWLALGKPPAFAQKRELTFLSWNHFVPAADDELAQAGRGLRQGEQLHGARGHDGAPADAGQDRGRGPVAVRPRHVPDGERRPVPLREPPRRRWTTSSTKLGKQGGGWYPFAAESCQTEVGLEGDPVVLGLLPGHLQHGPLQEGRASSSPRRRGTSC